MTTYTYYYQDLRFVPDLFTEEYDLDSDKEAFLQGLDIQNPWGFESRDGMSETDLVKELRKVDARRDTVVVLWIKKGSKKIYEA